MTRSQHDALSSEERFLAQHLGGPNSSPRCSQAAFSTRVRSDVADRTQRRRRLGASWLSAATCAAALVFLASPSSPKNEGRSPQEIFALSLAALDADALMDLSDDDVLIALAAAPLDALADDADDADEIDAEDAPSDSVAEADEDEDEEESAVYDADLLAFSEDASPSGLFSVNDLDDDGLTSLNLALDGALSAANAREHKPARSNAPFTRRF